MADKIDNRTTGPSMIHPHQSEYQQNPEQRIVMKRSNKK